MDVTEGESSERGEHRWSEKGLDDTLSGARDEQGEALEAGQVDRVEVVVLDLETSEVWRSQNW